MADGQVVFEITADGKRAIANVKDITAAIQSESKKWDRAADDSADNMEDSFLTMAKNVAAGLAASKVASVILDWGKAAISAASDLAEVQNVVDVTFGESAKQIESWSKTAGKQFGLTETQAKKFTSTLGAMMKSAGMAGPEIVEMSTDLAGLAADMASFYNLDFETAFQKIRSGISGETEPLKQLGINMSVANLEAFALEKGITKTFNSMSQSEQTMLRYQYLMKATADAQGDFARTSDGFANATRRVETALETIKTVGGSLLMTVIEPITSGLATMLEKLTATPEETLMDKINNINVETETKIADITKIADVADTLIGKLKLISGTSAGEALGKMAVGANKLDAGSPGTWHALFTSLQNVDGLENIFNSGSLAGKNVEDLANALSSSEVSSEKAEAWETFLSALSENAEAVSKLTGKSVEETAKWLQDLAVAANTIDAGDADAWDKLLTTLVSGFSADTPEGKQFIEGLAAQFLSMGSESEIAAKGLSALGFTSDQIADKQAEWLKTCKELVKTIPGLSDVINTETGEVKGGIGALEQYVTEWKASQEKLIRWKAYYAKLAAVQEVKDSTYALEMEAGGLRLAAQKARKNFEEAYADISKGQQDSWIGDALMDRPLSGRAKEYINDWIAVNEAEEKATKAENNYKTAVEQSAEELEKLAYEKEWLTETTGELTEEEIKAGEAGANAGQQIEEGLDSATQAVQDAVNAFREYAKQVYDSTAQVVNGIISGFDVVTKAGDDARKKSTEYAAEATRLKTKYQDELSKYTKNGIVDLEAMSQNYDSLTDKEKEAYNALAELHNKQVEVNKELENYKPETMVAGLQTQIDYMREYMDNLDKAKGLGFSDEFLASLADGSKESAEYLSQLAKLSKNDPLVEQLNNTYKEVQEKKKEFTEALTEQKLTADEMYQELVKTATEAVNEMNLGDEAKKAMGDTISGLANGIREHAGDVQQAVNSIISELDRLNNYGVSINIGPLGSFDFKLNGSYETGLDYVPFNGFLAELHEGEGILTAEENRIWQRFKNGGESTRNVDYGTLGDVMRDNVKPGGDVYLDGRIVGSVISEQQGRAYRQLKRSGWQA